MSQDQDNSEPTFDPDAAAAPDSGLFGLPREQAKAEAVVLPIPFDATASYRKGAALGPAAILQASRQIDLFDLVKGKPYERGIRMAEPDAEIIFANERATVLTERVYAGEATASEKAEIVREVDACGALVAERLHEEATRILESGALPVVLGGDHSSPLGAIQAAAKKHPGLGVLHFDAHADLRVAYEGFTYSHASILHNVLERTELSRLVQVGLRDVGEAEVRAIESSNGRIVPVWDHEWARAKLGGSDLRALIRDALRALPEEIWITFDIDGLDPVLCPNTGTPVPGGLTWHEAMLWLEEVAVSGKRILGCDLNEVSPGPDWQPGDEDRIDAIVGARLLYRLIGTAFQTR